ncbi:hypothetical protein, partial [Enterococcus faecium]|uniref:hypothetical protein n=1 Tax=Enterococcus faecium TaxID=1352 RepID=UPI003CC523CA
VALFMQTGLSVWSFLTFIDVIFIQSESIFRTYWIWLFGGSFLAPVNLFFSYLNSKTLFFEFYQKRLLGLLLASYGQRTGPH